MLEIADLYTTHGKKQDVVSNGIRQLLTFGSEPIKLTAEMTSAIQMVKIELLAGGE